MKVRTSISIDSTILTNAQKQHFNISEIANKALKERVESVIEVDIKLSDRCEFCNRKQERATPISLNGLTWLYPDERWICDKCLKIKGSRIPASIA